MVTQIQLGTLFNSGGKNVIAGGASTLDIEGLVKGLTEAKRQPAVLLEKKVEVNGKRSEALGEMKKLIEDFRDAADFLRNPPGVQNASDNVFQFRSSSVTTNTGIAGDLYMKVTAEPGAPVGSYDMQVNQLATRNIQTTNTFTVADPNAAMVGTGGSPLNAGLLLLGASATPVSINAGDSLNQVVSKINAVKGTSGVEATLIKINATDYRLSFKTLETGAAQNYDIATQNPALFNGGFSQQIGAVDAQVTLDGTLVTRSTNSISDLVDGITFNLVAPTPLATNLDVEINADTELAKSGIINFIDAYNAFRLFASRQSELGSNGRPLESAILSSDRALTTTMNRVNIEMSRAVEGLAAADPRALADLGITFADYPGDEETPYTRNILQVDEDKLSSAIQSDFDAVRRVFEFDVTSDDPNFTVFKRTNSLDVSEFTLDIVHGTNTYTATYDDNGTPVVVNLTPTVLAGGTVSLTGPAGTPLAGLVMVYASGSDATVNVNMTQGIGDRLFNTLDDMLDEDDGVVASAIAQLEEESNRYEKEIDKIDEQIERYRESLLTKFSALEQTISQINTLLQSLDAQTNAQNNN